MTGMVPSFSQQLGSIVFHKTVNEFRRSMTEGGLKLRPPFQRNIVWNDEQRSLLIDSILRGFPVPEIYVQQSVSSDGTDEIIVVDGQQRVSACLLFLAGSLRLEAKGEELDPRWSGRTFPELNPTEKQRFLSYSLVTRSFDPDLDEPVLREIFRRLNKTNVPLQAQELRHAAYSSILIDVVETVGKNQILTDIGVFSPQDYLRRRNDELIAEISMAIINQAFPNKKDGLEEIFLNYERNGAPEADMQRLLRTLGRVLEQLKPIASSLRRTRFRNKSDFYSLFVYLAKEAQRLPLDSNQTAALLLKLQQFSTMVTDLKREESEGRTTDDLVNSEVGQLVNKYLRAVERAASDRLSRIRRDEVLADLLGPVIAMSEPRAFSDADSSWIGEQIEDGENDEGEEDEAEELARLREALRDFGAKNDPQPS